MCYGSPMDTNYQRGFQDALADLASKVRDHGLAAALTYILDNAQDLTEEQRRVLREQADALR